VKRVVVTGAAGFIGWHVAHLLEASGLDVVRSDLVRPQPAEDVWKKADLLSLHDVMELTRGADAVCHLGGIGDVYTAGRDPQLALNVNACGTINVIEACKRNQIPRLVFASTWEVYGTPRYQPVDENHPCSPGHPYAVSKLAADLLVQHANIADGLTTTVLRLGTAYGPRIRSTAVLASFVRRAKAHEPIVINGTGNQFRQFTHVTDIGTAFRLALEARGGSPVYNIVAEESITIKQLAELVGRLVPTQITFGPSREDDAPPARVSSLLAERELGWRAVISFREGVEDFIRNAKSELSPIADRKPAGPPSRQATYANPSAEGDLS